MAMEEEERAEEGKAVLIAMNPSTEVLLLFIILRPLKYSPFSRSRHARLS